MSAVPRGWRLWLMATRPRTLTIAVAPVVAGSALAWSQGHPVAAQPMLMALLAAMLIQAGTNLHNDVADALRGGDPPSRVGPPRVTAMGWATPERVRRAALLAFALAALVGIYLAALGGWPILVLGLASLVAGWAYSGGPKPIAHTPLGEAFVVIFFGLGAVAGSAWLQGAPPGGAVLLLGVAVGLPAAAVLLVNNLRDREPDRQGGRHTLAIHLSDHLGRRLYAALMLAPFLVLLLPSVPAGALAGLAALPLSGLCIRTMQRQPQGAEFNALLGATARAQLIFAVLTALGLVLS